MEEHAQRLSNVEKGPGTSMMVELVYGGWKRDSAHGEGEIRRQQ